MTILDEYKSFINLLEECKTKYGEFSNSTLIVKLSIYIFLIENSNLKPFQYRIELLNDIIKQYNDAPLLSTRPPVMIDNDGEDAFIFIPDINDQYDRHKNEIKTRIINMDMPEQFNNIKINNWYIYVTTLDDKILILDSPQTTTELITGRKNNLWGDVQPEHPLLLCDYENLIVKSAGEMLVTNDKVSDDMHILINNKSGHFKPNVSSIKITKTLIKKYLNILDDKIHTIPFDFEDSFKKKKQV
ncbi:hypothetical protein MHB42_00210 [Lysinibacillus sp. FSL K6-0232]